MGFLSKDLTSGDAAASASTESVQQDPLGQASEVGSSSSGVAASWNPNVSAAPFVPGGLQNDLEESISGWSQADQSTYENGWGYADESSASAGYMFTGDGVSEDWYGDSMGSYAGSYHTTPDLNPAMEFDSSIGFRHLNSFDQDGAMTMTGKHYGNYKTQTCRHFERGHCSRGPECNFAHGEQDLRAPINVPKAVFSNKHNEPRSEILSMIGAWGALVAGPILEPAIEKLQLLHYRCAEDETVIPPEIRSLTCSTVTEPVNPRKPPK